VIVGGLDRGFISVYDAEKLIKGQEGSLIFSKDKHTGPVTALDFNPFQVIKMLDLKNPHLCTVGLLFRKITMLKLFNDLSY
jgi:hypothetical protein